MINLHVMNCKVERIMGLDTGDFYFLCCNRTYFLLLSMVFIEPGRHDLVTAHGVRRRCWTTSIVLFTVDSVQYSTGNHTLQL